MRIHSRLLSGLFSVALLLGAAPLTQAQTQAPTQAPTDVPTQAATPTQMQPSATTSFSLASNTIQDGGLMPDAQTANGQGCTGQNVSPELHWTNVPAGTQSFGVTLYDPDAPTGSGLWHWVMFNVPVGTTSIAAGAGDATKATAPAGSVQIHNDTGAIGYFGPCPPPGDKPHHYVFTVYALKVASLPLSQAVSGALVGFYLNSNLLGKATLSVYYGRPSALTLSSPALPNFSMFPTAQVGQGCGGANQSPALSWTGLPAGTQSLAVTMFDIDAPTGSGLWHWVLFNLPPTTTTLAAGAGGATGKQLPAGTIQVRNDTGTVGFTGACPPPGAPAHHYLITLFALKLDKLPLDATASGALVGFYLNGNALDKAFLIYTYGR